MMTRSLFLQMVFIAMAVGVVILHIKPAIAEIRLTQDQITVYEAELARVENVNTTLETYVNQINATSIDDIDALERYLPTTLDEISVMRDLQAITESVGVIPTTLEYTGPIATVLEEGETTTSGVASIPASGFSLTAVVSYAQIKELLTALETNDYVLSVQKLAVTPDEFDILTVKLDFAVYALTGPVTEETNE